VSGVRKDSFPEGHVMRHPALMLIYQEEVKSEVTIPHIAGVEANIAATIPKLNIHATA